MPQVGAAAAARNPISSSPKGSVSVASEPSPGPETPSSPTANSSSPVSTTSATSSQRVSTTSTTYASSPLGQPICLVNSSTNYDGCLLTTGPYWDAAYMDDDVSTNPGPYASQVSVVVAFPGTGQPSSFLQSGGWIAEGMVVQGQSSNCGLSCIGRDYAILAMLYVPSSGQPMVLGEDWYFNDCSVCGEVNVPQLQFGQEWTCGCLTASTYGQLTTLNMIWSGGSLYWAVTIGGVRYTLSNSYTPTNGQQTSFHVGTHQGTYKNEWFQFGVMTTTSNILNLEVSGEMLSKPLGSATQ